MTSVADASGWDARRDDVSAYPLEVVEEITWERLPEHDAVRLEMDAWGGDSILRDRVAHILEGLEAGEDLPEIVDRLVAEEAYGSRSSAIRNARNIVLGLAGQGNVEIQLPPVPEVFDGRYERLEELGRGAVGVAWLCRDLEASGDDGVVVKHAWNWTRPLDHRDRNLREEAGVMARLDHPGIVSLVDRFEIDGRFHMVRDFVQGEELGDRVFTEGPLDPKVRVRVARQVAAILDHLHSSSVLCMDLKPGNLMEEDRGEGPQVLLADLGHCQPFEEEPLPLDRAPGTRNYLAPEIFSEHHATRASDIYSLGKLYEFLTTASPPRQGEELGSVKERMEEEGATERDLAFVEACLAPDPADRPARATDAVKTLDE